MNTTKLVLLAFGLIFKAVNVFSMESSEKFQENGGRNKTIEKYFSQINEYGSQIETINKQRDAMARKNEELAVKSEEIRDSKIYNARNAGVRSFADIEAKMQLEQDPEKLADLEKQLDLAHGIENYVDPEIGKQLNLTTEKCLQLQEDRINIENKIKEIIDKIEIEIREGKSTQDNPPPIQ